MQVVSRPAEKSLAGHLLDAPNLQEQGLVPRNDELAAKLALANAMQARFQAENGVEIAAAAYNRITGRSLGERVSIDDLPAPAVGEKSSEELVAIAMRLRNDLESAETSGAFFAQARPGRHCGQNAVSRLDGWVQLPREPQYDGRGVLVRWHWCAMETVRWEHRRQQTCKHHRSGRKHRRSAPEFAKMIALQVRRYQLDLDESARRINVAQAAVKHAAENLRMILDRYNEGLAPNIEVLDAERLLTESEPNLANATADAALVDLKLKRAVGVL